MYEAFNNARNKNIITKKSLKNSMNSLKNTGRQKAKTQVNTQSKQESYIERNYIINLKRIMKMM